MDTENGGHDTQRDEITRDITDYCLSIRGKDLEVFRLINHQGTIEGIKGAIDFYADYSEPVTADEIIDFEESEPEALLDLISVLRTTEALIHVKESLPTSGLSSKDLSEIDNGLKQAINQGAALLDIFFQNDHRCFYETVGDFDRRAADLCMKLARKTIGGGP